MFHAELAKPAEFRGLFLLNEMLSTPILPVIQAFEFRPKSI